MAKCTCGSCGKVFFGVSGFDRHRTGNYGQPIYEVHGQENKKFLGYTKHSRRCLSTEEMQEIGMTTNKDGQWVTPKTEKFAQVRAKAATKEKQRARPVPPKTA